MYRHKWGRAYYVRSERGPYLPIQECVRCETRRNPFNFRIVAKRGGGQCWNAEEAVDLELESAERERIRDELRFLELAGEKVAWEYGAAPEPEATHHGGHP